MCSGDCIDEVAYDWREDRKLQKEKKKLAKQEKRLKKGAKGIEIIIQASKPDDERTK